MAKWMMNKKWVLDFDGGNQLNLMLMAKDLCLKTNWDKIAQESETHARRVGIQVTAKRNRYTTINDKMAQLWNRTNELGKKKLLNNSKHFAIRFNNGQGGHGGPNTGIVVGVMRGKNSSQTDERLGRVFDTLIHELCHVAHLHRYQATIQNGKRRPHDWLYNRIMLGAMKPFLNLKENDLNPYRYGWSIGAGYAPTKAMEQMFVDTYKSIEDLPVRLSKHFNKDIPEVKVKKVLTDEENEMKIASGFRTTLTSAFKGCGEYDGWTQVMGDSWDLDCPYEYMDILKETVKKTMTLKGLDDIQIEVLSWLINDENEHWMEMREMSWSAQEKKQDRLEELWRYLKGEN